MSVLPACTYMHHMCAWVPWNGVADSCEPPCGCWEPNLGPPQKQQVLQTAGPSLQPCPQDFWGSYGPVIPCYQITITGPSHLYSSRLLVMIEDMVCLGGMVLVHMKRFILLWSKILLSVRSNCLVVFSSCLTIHTHWFPKRSMLHFCICVSGPFRGGQYWGLNLGPHTCYARALPFHLLVKLDILSRIVCALTIAIVALTHLHGLSFYFSLYITWIVFSIMLGYVFPRVFIWISLHHLHLMWLLWV